MKTLLVLACGVALFYAHSVLADAPATKRPNIIVILGDDMGFSDLGGDGGEIHTPNLDALASGGVRFTQFYNTARRCPTRAALLTGLYSHQAGIGHMTEDKGLDGFSGELNIRCVTIAAASALAAAPTTLTATLAKGGAVTIKAGEQTIATGQSKLLQRQPQDGLQVGRDENGAVGEYPAPFAFKGKLGPVTLDLSE